MSSHTYFRFAALALLCAVVAACGGGGGSSGADNKSDTDAPVKLSVVGTAAKGFLIGADVALYPIRDGQISAEPLATTVTNENGEFRFDELPNISGPAVIEMKTNANTTMLDELNGPIAAPVGLVLRAVVADIANTGELNLTPFSEMAVSAVQSAGSWSAQVIEAANQGVSKEYLGGASVLGSRASKIEEYVDPLSEDRKAMTKALAALAAAADKKDAVDDKGAPCSNDDYAERIRCAVKGLAVGLTLNADGTSATATSATRGVLAKGLKRINQGEVELAESDGKTRHKSNEKLGGELEFEQGLKEPGGTDDPPPPVADVAKMVAAAKKMQSDVEWLRVVDGDVPAPLTQGMDDLHLEGPARGVRFFATLLQATRFLTGEIGTNALSGTRCVPGTGAASGSVSCRLLSTIDKNAYSDMVLTFKKGATADTFNWISRMQATRCRANSSGTFACAAQPLGVLQTSGAITAPADSNKRLVTLNASGTVLGLGRLSATQSWVYFFAPSFPKTYSSTGVLSGTLPFGFQTEINEPATSTAPGQKLPFKANGNYSPDRYSTMTLNASGTLQSAMLNLELQSPVNGPNFFTAGTLRLLAPRNGLVSGPGDPIPSIMILSGTHAGASGHTLTGRRTLELPTLAGFKPNDKIDGQNYFQRLTGLSGTVTSNDGVAYAIKARSLHTAPDVTGLDMTLTLQGARAGSTVKTLVTDKSAPGTFSLSMTHSNGIKFVGSENTTTSGTLTWQGKKVGTVNPAKRNIELIDDSTLPLEWIFGAQPNL